MGKTISKISKKWQLVIYITLMAGACAFFVSTLVTPKYQTQTTFLIFQKDVDIASAAQSAEFLSEVFAQVAFTEPFIDSVLESPYKIEKSFSFEPVKKQKQWKKDVIVESVGKAGVLKITVLDKSRLESRKIAQAIAHSFAKNSSEYYGGRGTIELKPINGPTTSDSPVSPNILLNTLLGLVSGFAVAIFISIFFESFNFKLIGGKNIVGELVEGQLKRQLAKRKEKRELTYEHDPEEEETEEEVEEIFEEEDEFVDDSSEADDSGPFAVEPGVTEELEESVEQEEALIEDEELGVQEEYQEYHEEHESVDVEAQDEFEIDTKEKTQSEEVIEPVFVPMEKETVKVPVIPEEDVPEEPMVSEIETSQEPDFEGSMISMDEFKKGVLIDDSVASEAEEQKIEIEEKIEIAPEEEKQVEEEFSSKLTLMRMKDRKQKKEVVQSQKEIIEEEDDVPVKEPSRRGRFLSRLYGKSIFSDKKIGKLKESRTEHQKEVPDFETEYLPQIESAKEIDPEEVQEPEVKIEPQVTSFEEVKNEEIPAKKGATAPAPENLPVFMTEEEVQEVELPTAKEFSPIEHVEDLEVVSPEELPVEEENKKSFEEMVLSGELKDGSGENQNEDQEEIERIEEEELEKKVNPDKEPTEDEVKERLNRLLKGEL